ncbi:aldo/keto reductase [Arthrobacter sp. GMC3]|uniref:aldo/keto reductase n=1 Tax=Arthrobacter sp. GMC3 TaxID=2058894 RepID=UPI000CE32FC0|nr:aldo/keto reductase [Arthrobacter sp. GMC3]
MEYANLGRTGLDVSRIALGCMSYGNPGTGLHQWTLDEDASQPFFRQALELGVTFWDTANVYQGGSSEEFVGRAIKRYARREDIVLATKVSGKMHDGLGGSGLSRRAILEQVDASLHRLGTDYIDVYYIHRFDSDVPVEETMETLHDVVTAGKVRHLGASSMFAWQFAKLQAAAAVSGWTPFSAMENQYNLLKREEEREMIPMCADMGVSLTPYSPLGKGRLTRPWGAQTNRADSDAVARTFDSPADEPIVNAVREVADARGLPMAQVALAWVLHNPVVASPIVGATKPHHLVDAVAALNVKLTDNEVMLLEKRYVPQDPYWY